ALGAAALLTAGALLSSPAAASGFSCGTRVVNEGMELFEVRAACGEPAQVTRTSILRRPVIWRHGRPWYVGEDVVPVPVETWIYNFGPTRLMRKLRFEDGVLKDVETLGYGHYDD
ncbi:MAG: DUF2845 domain-containing protein, partial [Pseudomonadota bacterium]